MKNEGPSATLVQTFDADTTLRWSCRSGDYVFWVRFRGPFADDKNMFGISDLWELQDGEFITITNRFCDLPVWFSLHPLETSGGLAYWMVEEANSGRYKYKDPMDGPSIWKALAGDKIVWIGERGNKSYTVLSILDLRENALVAGDRLRFDAGPPIFGAFANGKPIERSVVAGRSAIEVIRRMGLPREASFDGRWTISHR